MIISRELEILGNAFLSGMFLCSLYMALVKIREIIKHRMWLVNLEDVIYWSFTCGYLFVQIYHTNDGIIRGYYVLGIVIGATISWKSLTNLMKMWKKFVHSQVKKKIDKLK